MEIVAEIGSTWWRKGHTHESAMGAVAEVARAGATIAKFQIFRADTLYSRERAPHLHERVLKYELPLSYLTYARSQANMVRVKLWASVFDISLLDTVAIYVHGMKIASGDITYYDLLKETAKVCNAYVHPVILSTGSSTNDEIMKAIEIIRKEDPPKIILMHCKSVYPCASHKMNLRSILQFSSYVDEIGFSDHSLDNISSMLALAMGCSVFEKHYKIHGTTEDNPDYSVSLDYQGFCDYVNSLKQANTILGLPTTVMSHPEFMERVMARRYPDDWLRPNTSKVMK